MSQLNSLYDPLPGPMIFLGDVANTLWGSNIIRHRGRLLVSFIQENNFNILNDGFQTYFSMAYGSISAIDLFLCDLTLFSGLYLVYFA